MDHPHQNHGHPATFDEVIARGFPADGTVDAGVAAGARPPRPTQPTLQAALRVTTRLDQAAFTPDQQIAFKNALQQLVDEGVYEQLIRHHVDMSHRMHGSMGSIGLYRFLAWHRRYLTAFERELQRADAAQRGVAVAPLAVPYWRWQDPFPVWLVGFLPARDPATGSLPGARKAAPPPQKATASDVDLIVNQSSLQRTNLPGENEYTKFTWAVEGWGRRPDGSVLPAHNHGHSWIGGVMNNTSTSPTDPVFWLHHAEVDRLWDRWRSTHAAARPLIDGANLIMDPWPETYDELLDPAALGYAYEPGPL